MINVYLNTDAEETFNATQDDAPYNLDTNSITKVDAYVCGKAAASITGPSDDVSWSADVLTLKLGQLDLPQGSYQCKVKFYTAAQPLGWVIQELSLNVRC